MIVAKMSVKLGKCSKNNADEILWARQFDVLDTDVSGMLNADDIAQAYLK